jgi:hypothetical protein
LGHFLTNWAHAHASALSMIPLAAPVIGILGATAVLGESATETDAP